MRILLADDHTLILAGIQHLLESQHEIVGTAEDGQILVKQALLLKPDLVILDVSMPVLNGIDAALEIHRGLPATKFIFLSMHANPIYLRKAIAAGGRAYVLKSEAAEELFKAIEHVRAGELYVSPGFGHDVIVGARDWLDKPVRAVLELTERQRQILQLVAEGKQNKEIAELAHISVKTVEFHRSRLMNKLGAHNVAELTKFAVREGLVALPGKTEGM